MNQHQYKQNLYKLRGWLKNKNFELDVSHTVYDNVLIDKFSKIVEISARQSLKNQIYCLLHECGHIILKNNKNFSSQFPAYSSKKIKRKNNLLLEYDTIREETYAWDKGMELAKRLKIKLDQDDYRKFAFSKLRTYFI